MSIDRKDTTVYFTDAEIRQLINERKIAKKQKKVTKVEYLQGPLKGAEVKMVGYNGHTFQIHTRLNAKNEEDFSVIVSVLVEETNDHFHLRRYDGVDFHKNKIEGDELPFGFHIHYAKELYQKTMHRHHDGYAEPTDKYDDFYSALELVIEECNIVFEDQVENQEELFE